jgi:hypothetical protein
MFLQDGLMLMEKKLPMCAIPWERHWGRMANNMLSSFYGPTLLGNALVEFHPLFRLPFLLPSLHLWLLPWLLQPRLHFELEPDPSVAYWVNVLMSVGRTLQVGSNFRHGIAMDLLLNSGYDPAHPIYELKRRTTCASMLMEMLELVVQLFFLHARTLPIPKNGCLMGKTFVPCTTPTYV